MKFIKARMINTVKQYIAEHHLLSENHPVFIAVSGGRDSVALLDIMDKMRREYIVLHCNFYLRGEESYRDELFVRDLCERYNAQLIVHHFDTKQYAQEHGVSIEMAARELRYTWFDEMCLKLKIDSVAVAHHQDDQAETLMLNIIRGTGLRGLCAMKSRNGNIIRPMLCVNRQQIDKYINDNNLQYIDDSTNNETIYKRNKLRHEILPLMREMNPNILETLNRETKIFQQTNLLLDYYINKDKERYCRTDKDSIEIDIEQLRQHPLAQDLLYELIRGYGFSREQCSLICDNLDGQSGKRYISNNYELLKDRTTLFVYPRKNEDSVPQIIVERRQRQPQEHFPPTKANHAFFDVKILDRPLSLRHWQYGDTFYPLGMKQSRKLSDFFTDQKISIKRKSELWLLMSGEDIAWIIGERIDNRYKVKNNSSEIVEIIVV